MSKKIWIPLVLAAVVLTILLILFVPISRGTLDDGGTRDYAALTYRIVRWNRLTFDGVYKNTVVYYGEDRNKTIDELWIREKQNVEQKFTATVISVEGNTVVVESKGGEPESLICDRISFSTQNLEKINVRVGNELQITYKGDIMETYPAQINAIAWKTVDDLRGTVYEDGWLEKTDENKVSAAYMGDLKITKIYADCFFASPVIAMPYEFKINCTLSDEWCVGDQVSCEYENVYFDADTYRYEADLVSIKVGTFVADPFVAYKPVIYLYPDVELEASVKLDLLGELICTYPAYGKGWRVAAYPDGTLIDANGQTYSYLYWEGELNADYDLSSGFCVKGEDTAAFLEEALANLGLNRREANEFIVFWLPMMEKNPYNVISFQTDAYTDAARLQVDPSPDTLIRVFMAWYGSDSYVELPPQELSAPESEGLRVVEWGGSALEI